MIPAGIPPVSAQPETKLSKLLALMRAGEWGKAMSLAAKFGELGEHKAAITRAHNAALNPAFYTQLHQSPAEHIQAGIAALKARYPYWGETK